MLGRRIDQYQIRATLGEGGMGTVYLARDVVLERSVAIKIMHPLLARQEQFQQRFMQEARAVARLAHPSIIEIYEFGEAEDSLFMAMAYAPGGSLAEYLRRLDEEKKQARLRETLYLMAQVASALGYAHHYGVIHRDVKPDNVLLQRLHEVEREGEPPLRAVVTDFGLAKLIEGGVRTQTGTFMGTLPYMSPEQVLGEPVDGRSDIYSLGIMLYRLLTGRLPLEITSPTDAVRKHLSDTPLPAPREIAPNLPAAVATVIERSIARDPAERFQSATRMARVLREAASSLDPAEVTRFAPPPKIFDVATQVEQVEAAPPEVVDATLQMAEESPTAAPARQPPSPPVWRRPIWWAALAGGLLLVVLTVVGAAAVWTLLAGDTDLSQLMATNEPAAPTLVDLVEADWEEGYGVTSMAYGRGRWAAVLSERQEAGQERLQLAETFPQQLVAERWEAGDEIVSATYGESRWALAFAPAAPQSRQLWRQERAFPGAFVRDKWGEGFDVTEIAYGEGSWLVVMTQEGDAVRQLWQAQPDFPQEFVAEKWAEGFDLTDVAYGRGRWVVVMTESLQPTRQRWESRPQFPAELIREAWSEGYDVTEIAHGASGWLLVLTEGPRNLRQTWHAAAAFE